MAERVVLSATGALLCLLKDYDLPIVLLAQREGDNVRHFGTSSKLADIQEAHRLGIPYAIRHDDGSRVYYSLN